MTPKGHEYPHRWSLNWRVVLPLVFTTDGGEYHIFRDILSSLGSREYQYAISARVYRRSSNHENCANNLQVISKHYIFTLHRGFNVIQVYGSTRVFIFKHVINIHRVSFKWAPLLFLYYLRHRLRAIVD